MKFKHSDILIPQDDPFTNCKLDRQQYAIALTNIINNYEDNFVLAINSPWGTGKTTFVKMWDCSLQNNGYKTLYLNAWENDLLTDPTIAILGELKKLTTTKDKSKFKKILGYGAIVTKNVLPAIVKATANKYVDSKTITEAIENSLTAATEIVEKEVEGYSKKAQTIHDFKTVLSEFIKASSSDKPVVFIVDELDRCRPDYAVEILEKVKHFFSVPGIVFVLVIDKIQLCNSIKGFYGSESIDSSEYLRRFIDIEFGLPAPNIEQYCKYLYDYFEFSEFFESAERLKCFRGVDEKALLLNIAKKLCSQQQLTLRQIEKIFTHSRVGLLSMAERNYVLPNLYFLLIFLRDQHPLIYKSIVSKKLSIQELSDVALQFLDTSTPILNELYLYSEFLMFYDLYLFQYRALTLVEKETKELTFKTTADANKVIECIEHIYSAYHGYNLLPHLLDKIELYSSIQ